MKTIRLFGPVLLLLVAAVGVGQDDPRQSMLDQIQQSRERMARDVDESERAQSREVDELSNRMRAQYEQLVRRMEEERERLRLRVARQWTDFHESTTDQWVEYSDRGDAMSRVDFEDGTIEIETLVPVEDVARGRPKARLEDLDGEQRNKLEAIAARKIAEQARAVVEQKDERGVPVVKDQIRTPEGKAVTAENVDAFVKRTVAPKLVVEESPVVAQDGKPRLKVKARIEMVPDHIKIRAKQHEAQVVEVAEKYGLDPALVFAVIHTESNFNPRARSHAPAFGLMQLMPRSGAREAYKFLYREEKILDPEYLYDPRNNILLGATYLHMLHKRHFGKVKNADNRRTLSIAAYNCGPGCVRKNILSKYDADSMSNEELLALIQRAVPKETREYVPRVQERMALYRSL